MKINFIFLILAIIAATFLPGDIFAATQKESTEGTKLVTTKDSFTFAKGTKFNLGNEVIELTEDTAIPFEGAANEGRLAGMLSITNNLDANRENLKFRYNGFGALVPIEGQVDDPDQIDDFLMNLSDDEATGFGLLDRRNELRKQRETAAENRRQAESDERARASEIAANEHKIAEEKVEAEKAAKERENSLIAEHDREVADLKQKLKAEARKTEEAQKRAAELEAKATNQKPAVNAPVK